MDTTDVMTNRSEFALCISIEERENDEVRLVFDDVKLECSTPLKWELFAFVTNVDMSGEAFNQFRFSDEQLAEFGRTVLGALAVHLKRPERRA